MSNNHRGIRRNEAIRVREVRVIGPEGTQLGVLPIADAIRAARNLGVDLIEIAPNANPPVCRIMDFGKYKYELAKKERDQNKVTTKLKEIKLRVRIDIGDYKTKMRHAEEFLMESNKVKLTLSFRMREMAHPQLGMDVVHRAIADLANVATPDNTPRQAGRAIVVMMSPLPGPKRKAKWTAEPIDPNAPTAEEMDARDEDESEE